MKKKYDGMTVNERLFVSGLLDLFDKAVARKDTAEVISILKKIDLSDTSIAAILDSLKLK